MNARCPTKHCRWLVLTISVIAASRWCFAADIEFDGSDESIQHAMRGYLSRLASLQTATKTQTIQQAFDSSAQAERRPNFVLILTDDQDLLLNSTHPRYMPAMHERIASKGLWMRQYTASTTVCCPSRVNLLTGMFTHNTNVSSNVGPRGGYDKFQSRGLDESYLPKWLSDLGYRTYFTGKFLNGFNPAKVTSQRCPSGWTLFEPLVQPYILHYYETSFSSNCGPTVTINNQYTTDVLLNKTLTYIEDALKHPETPFYIHINPIAPHESCGPRDDKSDADACNNPPLPAKRHAHMYKDVDLPTTSNYGIQPPSGTFNWVDVQRVGPRRSFRLLRMRELYRMRLRSLRAVDEMIDRVAEYLEAAGQLDNTYFIFMSDNGFKIGNHGVYKGKLTAYEEDVRVPFFIRGPGIGQGLISDYQATMCDLPATILDLAGGVSPPHVDGTPLPLKRLTGFTPISYNPLLPGASSGSGLQGQAQLDTLRDQVPHEMWVWGSDERLTNKSYRALRVCTSHLAFGSAAAYRRAASDPEATFGFRLHGTVPYSNPNEGIDVDTPITCYKYVVWCTGTRELYDLMLDSTEIRNRYEEAPTRLMSRLDAYLHVQGFCKGRHCYAPYDLLHPAGEVMTFDQAMDPQYDPVYDRLPVFRFKQCMRYNFPENEESWLKYNHIDGQLQSQLVLPTDSHQDINVA